MRYALVLLCVLTTSLIYAQDNMAAQPDDHAIDVAVVTGGHDFDEPPFLAMFEGLEGIRCAHLPQKEGSEFLEDIAAWPYDVILLYNMSRGISEKRQANLLALLNRGVGLVMVHHAIANYPDWPEYGNLIGATYYLEETTGSGAPHPRSEYTHDTEVRVKVEDPQHPVTRGVSDFVAVDEVYRKWDCHPGNHLLLSTDNPESNRELAWIREEGNRRVCCIQPGHGPSIFSDANYRRLIEQAIRWTARQDDTKK